MKLEKTSLKDLSYFQNVKMRNDNFLSVKLNKSFNLNEHKSKIDKLKEKSTILHSHDTMQKAEVFKQMINRASKKRA